MAYNETNNEKMIITFIASLVQGPNSELTATLTPSSGILLKFIALKQICFLLVFLYVQSHKGKVYTYKTFLFLISQKKVWIFCALRAVFPIGIGKTLQFFMF